MTKPGPKPRPLALVSKEGNTAHAKPRSPLKLAPGAPAEPDWTEWFTVENDDCNAAIEDARSAWSTLVEQLDAVGALAELDRFVLADACVCWAMVRWCQRDIAVHGVWTEGERGAQKNPSTTAANQYRTQLKFYVAELGLSPSSRERLTGRESSDGDEDSPWDAMSDTARGAR